MWKWGKKKIDKNVCEKEFCFYQLFMFVEETVTSGSHAIIGISNYYDKSNGCIVTLAMPEVYK